MKNLDKKILSFGLILAGIVSIVFAILCFEAYIPFDYADWVSYKTYGGDAYTGIQNATAQTANNIATLNSNIESVACIFFDILGYFFILIALILFVVGVSKLVKQFVQKTQQKNDNI